MLLKSDIIFFKEKKKNFKWRSQTVQSFTIILFEPIHHKAHKKILEFQFATVSF